MAKKTPKAQTATPAAARATLNLKVPPELEKELRAVVAARKTARRKPTTLQGIAEAALADWLRKHGRDVPLS